MGEDKSLRLSIARELRFIVIKEIWYQLKSFKDAHSYESGGLGKEHWGQAFDGGGSGFLYGGQGKYIEAIEIC